MLGEGLKVMKRLTKRLQELEDMKKSPQEA